MWYRLAKLKPQKDDSEAVKPGLAALRFNCASSMVNDDLRLPEELPEFPVVFRCQRLSRLPACDRSEPSSIVKTSPAHLTNPKKTAWRSGKLELVAMMGTKAAAQRSAVPLAADTRLGLGPLWDHGFSDAKHLDCPLQERVSFTIHQIDEVGRRTFHVSMSNSITIWFLTSPPAYSSCVGCWHSTWRMHKSQATVSTSTSPNKLTDGGLAGLLVYSKRA